MFDALEKWFFTLADVFQFTPSSWYSSVIFLVMYFLGNSRLGLPSLCCVKIMIKEHWDSQRRQVVVEWHYDSTEEDVIDNAGHVLNSSPLHPDPHKQPTRWSWWQEETSSQRPFHWTFVIHKALVNFWLLWLFGLVNASVYL